MTERFALRRCWATRFLWPMVRHDAAAEISKGQVRVAMGWLGHAEIDAANVARLSRMRWPWWGGLGVRLGRGMVAYTERGATPRSSSSSSRSTCARRCGGPRPG